MNLGDTFLNAAGRGVSPHLWIVLSDPARDPDRVVIANVNTVRDYTSAAEAICRLSPGDHPFIRHASYVNFAEARIVTLTALVGQSRAGKLTPQPPADAALVRRIQLALAESPRAKIECYRVLDSQGFYV